MLIAILSLFMTISGYFSHTIRAERYHIYPTQIYNRCNRAQRSFNCVLSLAIFSLAVTDFLVSKDLLVSIFILFVIQIMCNGIYTIVSISIARWKRHKMIRNSLLSFLEKRQSIEMSNDAILLKQFCREYPDIFPKEAVRALNAFKKSKH